MGWVDRGHFEATSTRTVLEEGYQRAERPPVDGRRLWKLVADICEILDGDHRCVVVDRLLDDVVGNAMKPIPAAASPAAVDLANGSIGASSTRTLEFTLPANCFTLVVMELAVGEEPTGTRNRELLDAQINPEHCSVFGGSRGRYRAPEPQMYIKLIVTDGKCAFGELPPFIIEILVLIAVRVGRKNEIRLDTFIECRQGDPAVVEQR